MKVQIFIDQSDYCPALNFSKFLLIIAVCAYLSDLEPVKYRNKSPVTNFVKFLLEVFVWMLIMEFMVDLFWAEVIFLLGEFAGLNWISKFVINLSCVAALRFRFSGKHLDEMILEFKFNLGETK
jgi:hypothetical protein